MTKMETPKFTRIEDLLPIFRLLQIDITTTKGEKEGEEEEEEEEDYDDKIVFRSELEKGDEEQIEDALKGLLLGLLQQPHERRLLSSKPQFMSRQISPLRDSRSEVERAEEGHDMGRESPHG
jgi:hypothetical protein